MSHDFKMAVGYLGIGALFFFVMAVDDLCRGRGVQKRDYHLWIYWPLTLPVILVLGILEFSRITSSDEKSNLGPRSWFR